MEFDEEDLLNISGIKHYAFCPRRWALEYVEGLWAENQRTLEGHYLHENAHDGARKEARGGLVLSRGMPVASRRLGITGVCDVVELIADSSGVPIAGRAGRYRVYPVEYKLGRPDPYGADRLQLCAQALCLEEMLACDIPEGALYYGDLRSREPVVLDGALRGRVLETVSAMRALLERGQTPSARRKKACNGCSMLEFCQVSLFDRPSAARYLEKRLEEGAQ